MRSKIIRALCVAGLFCACSGDNGAKDLGPDYLLTDAKPDKKVIADTTSDSNLSKIPSITQILPDNGFATSTTRVTLTGKNFAQGAVAYIDGGQEIVMNVVVASSASASFIMPKSPYTENTDAGVIPKPQTVSVKLKVGNLYTNSVDFQYHLTQAMTSKLKGSVTTATTSCYADFPSDPIEAKVFIEGITDTTTGVSSKITAQIGYGTAGTDPGKSDGWRWVAATFSKDDTTYDVYTGKLKVPLVQTYDVAYRFSTNTGKTWVYADTDETNLAYETSKAAKLTSSQAPLDYCLSDADCTTNAHKPKCYVNTSDKSKNKCVECLTGDSECSSNTKAWGPHCDTTKMICYCSATSECTSNPNGHICVSSGKFCGCSKDGDCPSGTKCNGQTYYCQ